MITPNRPKETAKAVDPALPKFEVNNTRNHPALVSFMTIRRCIGWIGMLLPFALLTGALLLGCEQMQPSISAYYYTRVGVLFTGSLCAVGLFLVTYKGFGKWDDAATNIAGALAFAVALFPTGGVPGNPCNIYAVGYPTYISVIHYASAGLFFATLSFISYFLFTQSDGNVTENKRRRNMIYRTCAVLMVIFAGMIPLLRWDPLQETVAPYNPTFWLECGALVSFGVSWLVKGEVILKG